MTSRERLLAAFRREEVDYLPCSIYFNANLRVDGYDLTRARERARLALDLGTDPVIDVGIGAAPHPEVRTRTWVVEGEPAVLYKEYVTPAGTLRMGVRYTAEWPHGRDIRWGDFSAGHCVEPLVKTPDDVDAFRYLHRPPTPADLDAARPWIDEVSARAEDLGLAVRATCGMGLAKLMHVMGAQDMVLFAVDHPEAFEALAEIDHRTNLARIALLAEAGVDILKRFGGYEQTNLLSPEIFRRVVRPRLAAEAAAARSVGTLIYYRVVTGAKPLLADIAEAGFDCVEGFEPVLSRCSHADVHAAFVGRACIWTGVSSPGCIGAGDEAGVRRAVREAVDVFGKRGFILGITNSIRNHWPWENTLALIEEWRKLR